jgi:hypothetical protein
MVVVLAVLQPSCCYGDVSKLLNIVPDLEVQKRLEVVGQRFGDPQLSDLEKMAAILDVGDLAKADPTALFGQMFYYYCRWQRQDRKGESRQWAMIFITKQLQLSNFAIISVVTPYLNAENEELKSMAHSFLRMVEGEQYRGERNFSYYYQVIEQNKAAPPLPLVAYMFERSPSTALHTFIVVYRDTAQREDPYRGMLWGEHVIADAIWRKEHRFIEKGVVPPEAAAELVNLSKHEEWWARLYVAALLKQHPEFGTPPIVERLSKDEHELVRKLAADLRK